MPRSRRGPLLALPSAASCARWRAISTGANPLGSRGLDSVMSFLRLTVAPCAEQVSAETASTPAIVISSARSQKFFVAQAQIVDLKRAVAQDRLRAESNRWMDQSGDRDGKPHNQWQIIFSRRRAGHPTA